MTTLQATGTGAELRPNYFENVFRALYSLIAALFAVEPTKESTSSPEISLDRAYAEVLGVGRPEPKKREDGETMAKAYFMGEFYNSFNPNLIATRR